MTRNRIILPLLIFATGCYPLGTGPFAPAAPPDIMSGPPYLQPTPDMIQPGPQLAPVFPAPQLAPAEGPLADFAPGGQVSPQFGLPTGPDVLPQVPNTISVPVVDDLWAWEQITDVVSGYFTTIAVEQQARRGAEGWTEGRIETAPQSGATLLEPHRGDSVGSFNRWESTFQTIRRKALVRVVPDAVGYNVEVVVEKELEHLPRPVRATSGAATFANESSLPSRRVDEGGRTRSSQRWIPLGRDPPLEQRILAEIHARLAGATTPGQPAPWR